MMMQFLASTKMLNFVLGIVADNDIVLSSIKLLHRTT